jgi:sterol desaturase/sphingolipid hydroxylase (fatty acid hydroxylase superfamily)
MKKTLTEVVMVSKTQFENLQKLYKNHLQKSKNAYVIFFAKDQDISVTVYEHDEQFNIPLLTSGKWHMIHHRSKHNYGLFFPIWDIVFNTYKKIT